MQNSNEHTQTQDDTLSNSRYICSFDVITKGKDLPMHNRKQEN